jgi:hypothetical protein
MEGLRWPWKAQGLASGHTLIADARTRRVFEVTPDKKEVWDYNGDVYVFMHC